MINYIYNLVEARRKEKKEYLGFDYIESSLTFLLRASEEIASFRMIDFNEALDSFGTELSQLEEVMHVFPDDERYFESYRLMYLMLAQSSALLCMLDYINHKLTGNKDDFDITSYCDEIRNCVILSQEYLKFDNDTVKFFITCLDLKECELLISNLKKLASIKN